jgi:predicted transcriptional regulator
MSTTSLKLPDKLKQRTTAAAQRLGITPHAFMVGAIEQAALSAEARGKFIAESAAARRTTLKSGKGYDAEEVHAYLKRRIVDKKVLRPKAKSWRA